MKRVLVLLCLAGCSETRTQWCARQRQDCVAFAMAKTSPRESFIFCMEYHDWAHSCAEELPTDHPAGHPAVFTVPVRQ